MKTEFLTNPTALDFERYAKRLRGKVDGYADTPGGGPEGERCRTCKHIRRGGTGGSMGRFFKCGLVKPTSGLGTDIRLKSPACSLWEWAEKIKTRDIPYWSEK